MCLSVQTATEKCRGGVARARFGRNVGFWRYGKAAKLLFLQWDKTDPEPWGRSMHDCRMRGANASHHCAETCSDRCTQAHQSKRVRQINSTERNTDIAIDSLPTADGKHGESTVSKTEVTQESQGQTTYGHKTAVTGRPNAQQPINHQSRASYRAPIGIQPASWGRDHQSAARPLTR